MACFKPKSSIKSSPKINSRSVDLANKNTSEPSKNLLTACRENRKFGLVPGVRTEAARASLAGRQFQCSVCREQFEYLRLKKCCSVMVCEFCQHGKCHKKKCEFYNEQEQHDRMFSMADASTINSFTEGWMTGTKCKRNSFYSFFLYVP